jgi:hypothetical protein
MYEAECAIREYQKLNAQYGTKDGWINLVFVLPDGTECLEACVSRMPTFCAYQKGGA